MLTRLRGSAWNWLLAAALLPVFCSCRALPTVESPAKAPVASAADEPVAPEMSERTSAETPVAGRTEARETAQADWSLSDRDEAPHSHGIAPVLAEQPVEQPAEQQKGAAPFSVGNTTASSPGSTTAPHAAGSIHALPGEVVSPAPRGAVSQTPRGSFASAPAHSPALPHGMAPHRRAPHRRAPHAHRPGMSLPATAPHPGLPAAAYTTGGACSCCPSPGAAGKWTPPGIKQPWPEDEYLCDGGDQETQVRVSPDWTVWGLDQEDTVAHFDTKDGRTIVEPSNCVCIYSPRFAAVRRVDGVVQYKQRQHMAGMEAPLSPELSEELLVPSTVNQPLQPGRHLASTPLDIFQERTRGLTVDRAEVPAAAENAFRPYEDFLFIRRGQYDASEKPRLAERIDAALAWTHADAVQVVIDGKLAAEAVGQSKLESVYTYELKGKPRLRICKIASTCAARPGEIVEFTLRFDNVGDQTIGNVTIIDHLTTRLEYVEGSQSSTLEADFFAIDDQDVSLILRWEIKEPVKVGEGGLIRFKCRVR